MTRFENRLGGKVVVMGLTLDRNHSQALYNYRRQRLLQEQLLWCGADYALVKDAPDIYAIMNLPTQPESVSFKGMLTLINLCEDSLEELRIHLPLKWRPLSNICHIAADGTLQPCKFAEDGEDVILKKELPYLAPLYLIFS
jgi:hypothetical protein